MHVDSKGIICAHRTHCGRFLRAHLSAICRALLENTLANAKGKRKKGGENQRWPTSGPECYITLAAEGIPRASERRTKSELAQKWAGWLHNPYRLEGPRRFKAGDKIRGGPQVGWVTTLPLPPRGSPQLQSGGQNQQRPTNGPGVCITPATCRVPNASERGTKSEVAHKWARWLHNPCLLGCPQRFKAGEKISSGPQVGRVPNTSEQGAKSEVAHKCASWLHNPCLLGGPQPGPHSFRAGHKIRSGAQMGRVAT